MLHAHRPEIEQFFSALFRYAEEGSYVALRAFDQFDRGKNAVLVRGVRIGRNPAELISQAATDAETVANYDFPVVFAPPVATFSNPTRARGEDIACGVAISVDLDEVNPQVARQRLEALLGPATITVASGGEWSDPQTGELQPKLHIHWRLSEPTTTAPDHSRLRQARYLAAVLVGADKTAASLAHPLRWPGTWNRKTKPKLAMTAGWNLDAEVHLDEALEALEAAVEAAGLEKEDKGARVSGTPQASIALIVSAVATLPNADVHWDDWVRMGMTIWRATGAAPEGLEAWENWSGKSGKYTPGSCEERWAHFAGSPPTRLGAGSLFFLAKREGWVRPGRVQQDAGPPEPDPDDPGYQPPAPSEEPEHAPRRSRRREGGAIAWGEPVDFLSDDKLGNPELMPHHIPDALWGFVKDISIRMGVDPAGVALGSLVCCASVISDRWKLQPRRHDYRWTESARIWGAILGGPSTIKSPQISACSRPVEKLEAEAGRRHAEEKRIYKAALEVHKAKVKAKEPSDEPTLPRRDRFMVEGTTMEALQEVLRDDDEAKNNAPAGKVLSRWDEMSEFFANLDRFKGAGGSGGDRGAYLRLYNGGMHTIDRVGRGHFSISSWSACLLGGCQPGPIQRIARESVDDGLLQRFLWCVPVRQDVGIDQRPDHAAEKRYERLFDFLPGYQPSREIGTGHIHPIVLHQDGHAIREEIDAVARAMQSMPDASPRLQSTFGKWGGQFARLVLTFHMINIADARAQGLTPPPVAVVPLETVQRVADYMQDIVLPHLLRADAMMFSTNQTGHARWVAGHILAAGIERITTRDVTRAYGALRAPESARDLSDVMASLVAVGWLEPEESNNPAKPTHAWTVNPAVHSVFKARAEKERASRQQAKEASAKDMSTLSKKRKAKESP